MNEPISRMVYRISAVVSVIIILLSFPLRSTAEQVAKKEVVKIGVIAPLTGGESRRGDDIVKMISIFKERLNTKPSRYEYQFFVEDGKCGAGSATTTAAMKLIDVDKIKFLLTACSGETLQAGPIAQRAKVLTLAVLSLHPDVSKIGDYVFRTYIDVETSIVRFVKYLNKKFPGEIALLTEENAFTFGIRDLLQKYLGPRIGYSQNFAMDSTEFGTLLARVKASGAQAVYFNAASEGTLAKIVNDAAALRLNIQIFSYAMPESSFFRKSTGGNSDGVEFLGTPEVSNETGDFKLFDDEFKRRSPEGPSLHYLLRTTYDAVKVISEGVAAVGNDPTRVRDFLKTYRGQGALGVVEFDETRNIKNQHFVLKRIGSDGSIKVIDTLDR